MLKQCKQILLVEDEEALVFGLHKLLQTPVNPVDTARTFDAAQRFIHAKNYDVLITDLNLSQAKALEGLELIREIKALQPECKVIAMTAYGDDPLGSRAGAAGADYYLEKPIPPRALKDMLHSIGFHNNETMTQL
jgi:DNA-binding response OmpR family regulator